ncbi:hypothetical protein DCAR_0104263 [Daucus carota subsp. sativus]|uniref:Uncharacterized protein n=1 Tax=Daucus carota subsp. sativus TaxID=79200 RepID=A0AAF0WA58_DAUCS|nr:PREDICTED: uncharacterized protein LOC108210429 [Daucus carota subsp. sativus]WOG85076.1 hypothetical protein DCAR_0104263 [Daucus carota subsp. sativus]
MDGNKIDFNAPLLSVRVNRKTKEVPRPVRNLSLPSQKSDWELTEVAKPAAVPFIWEQIPGRPKNGSTNQSLSPPERSVSPMFPPGRTFDNKKRVSGEQFQDKYVCRPHVEASHTNDDVKCLDVCKKSAGSLSDDESYSDALDTLLESESISWNCSVSGLSDYDSSYARSSSNFSADPQTREIMMTRFLPAARAMAVKKESKKQTMPSELPRHVRQVLSGELRPTLEKYGSNTAIHPKQYKGSVASEDEDNEFIERGRKSIKACGLLPRLCVKNSLSLLGPVPGTKSRAQSPIPSVPEFRRMARTAHSGPLPQTHHEKQDWNDVYWKNMQKNIQSRVQAQELVNNKLNGVSKRFNHNTDLYKTKGLSPHRLSRSGGVSPFRNEKPQSPFYDGARFLGIPKIVKDDKASEFRPVDRESDKQDISVHQIYKQGSGPLIALDPPYDAEVPNLDSYSLKIGRIDKAYEKTLGESRQVEGLSPPKSFPQEKVVKPILLSPPRADKPSYTDIYVIKNQETSDGMENHEQDIGQKPSAQCLASSLKDNLDKIENTEKVKNQDKSNSATPKSPKPPPLPKSPSESWLWRTVPAVSLRNPFSQNQPKKQHQKPSKTAAKWETIVKASHVRHEHLRHSEERASLVSQHAKT